MEELKFEIIKPIVETKISNGKKVYYYYSEVKCKICGYTKKIYKNDKRHMVSCKVCNIKKHNKEFVGFENIMYKVLKFSHQKNNKLYYDVMCKKCKSIITMRKDAIKDDLKCSCINCKSNGITASLKSPLNVYQYYYMQNAKKRNFEWSLTQKEFKELISKPCFYCGSFPKPLQFLKRYTKVKEELYVNGIDRFDSNIGYNYNNCKPCCTICNRMKLNYTAQDFLNQISNIFNYSMKSSTTIPNGSTSQANGDGSGENP